MVTQVTDRLDVSLHVALTCTGSDGSRPHSSEIGHLFAPKGAPVWFSGQNPRPLPGDLGFHGCRVVVASHHLASAFMRLDAEGLAR